MKFVRYSFHISSTPPKAQDKLLWSLAVIHRLSTPLNDFSSETPGIIFFKFHLESSVNGWLKIGSDGHGLLIKLAAMPIYGKNT